MRRLNANDPTTTTLGVRLPADVLTALDAEVDRVNTLAVGATATRSTVARALLTRALLHKAPAPSPLVALPKPADAVLEHDELREQFSTAIAEGRTTYEAAAMACGCSPMPLRSWASGRARDGKRTFKPLAPEYREALSRFLVELVPSAS